MIRRRIVAIATLLTIAAAYPSFVLGYTWAHVAESGLAGGRNGPLDAYRHTLASAIVSFTLSPRVVDSVTWLMERGGRPANLMDQRNNRIGSTVGEHARSFSEIEPTVRERVLAGAIDAADPEQVTWLSPQRWGARRWW